MTNNHSTLHPFDDATVEGPEAAIQSAHLEQLITRQWQAGEIPDLVGAIARHPEVLDNRSVLLNLAMIEYREYQLHSPNVALQDYCDRFSNFGRSVQQSIFRQLETQQYLDNHPELLDMLEIPQWPEVGEVFGTFRLIEELGSGGIARVYLATQGDLGDRLVVVKATPCSSYEAAILGRLSHPHIVPIHFADHVEEYHLSFLCMPYYGRSTLVDLIDLAFEQGRPRHGRVVRQAATRWLPRHERAAAELKYRRGQAQSRATYVGAVLKLALQVSEALQYAHQQGIVHGDLKPSNILLTPVGEPLLLDFNLSRETSAPTGACGGTLAYMPPEQLRQIALHERSSSPSDTAGIHDARAVPPCNDVTLSGPTTDIYSFGALLYELLAGVPPLAVDRQHHSPRQAALHLLQQLKLPRVPLRERNSDVPRGLESLIMRCLAIDPRDRPQSMAEICRELQSHADWPAEITRRVRRHPQLVAVSVLLLAGGLTSLGLAASNQPPPHVELYQSAVAAQEAGDWKQAEAKLLQVLDLQPQHHAAQLELGRTYLAQGQLDLAISTLEPLGVEESADPRIMELIGYVYNLRKLPTAAISWYERSLDQGGGSVASYNNLAASFLSGGPKLAQSERLRSQEFYLIKASELDSNALPVWINQIRHAVAKSIDDPGYDPREVTSIVELLQDQPPNPAIDFAIKNWESAVDFFLATRSIRVTLVTNSQKSLEIGTSQLPASTKAAFSNFEVLVPHFTAYYIKPDLAL